MNAGDPVILNGQPASAQTPEDVHVLVSRYRADIMAVLRGVPNTYRDDVIQEASIRILGLLSKADMSTSD